MWGWSETSRFRDCARRAVRRAISSRTTIHFMPLIYHGSRHDQGPTRSNRHRNARRLMLYLAPMQSPSIWRRPRVLVVVIAISLGLWALIFWAGSAFATETCQPVIIERSQSVVLSLCEIAGAPPRSRACTIPAGQNTPPTILMPTAETALTARGEPMSPSERRWTLAHEYQHACHGLPAERGARVHREPRT